MTKNNRCIQCGWCCKHIHYFYPNTPVVSEWLKARGFKIVQFSKTHIEASIYNECPHLKATWENGKEKYYCGIQDKKPRGCKSYPGIDLETYEKIGLDPNKSLGPNCGFRC